MKNREYLYTFKNMNKEDFNIETQINLQNQEIKRWTIYDTIVNKIYDISDREFNEGVQNDFIKLRGQFININNKKVWIDGIVLK